MVTGVQTCALPISLFSLLATILQRALDHTALMSPMMESSNPWFGGGLLIVAGIFQFTPWKRTCLNACRSPAEFLVRHWRPGVAGGFYLGVANGLFCLGCCWVLMCVLYVVGAMNLVWVAALSVFVLAEKIGPAGAVVARVAGALMIIVGLLFVAGIR